MPYAYSMLALVTLLFFLFSSVEIWMYIRERQALARLKKMPFPNSYEEILDKLYIYKRLTQEEQKQMHFLILRFMYQKNIVGIQGMQITDEVKVLIAFYACLLLLHIKRHDLYGNLQTVLVYPYEFILKEIQSFGGVYTTQRFILEGQSANDTVVLSWHHVKKDAYHHYENNVIVHEFAHELDFLDGEIDGVPPMDSVHFASWSKHLFSVFKELNAKTLKGRFIGKYKLFGSYAASSEAEFFAVATERFFQSPVALKKKFPLVYEELKNFYHIDMAEKYPKLP